MEIRRRAGSKENIRREQNGVRKQQKIRCLLTANLCFDNHAQIASSFIQTQIKDTAQPNMLHRKGHYV